VSRPLTIFVFEYLTGGACGDVPLESSLMTEGRAMADAVIADFAELTDVQVVTLKDRRLPAVAHPAVTTHFVDESNQELSRFQLLCASVDRVLAIAPETGGVLTQRVEQARQLNRDGVLNCGPEALRHGSDKWEFFRSLQDWGIPTISTKLWNGDLSAGEFPVVIKPRDGAGCEGVQVIREIRDTQIERDDLIVQPLRQGIALSSAACFSERGERLLTLPVGKQLVEIDDAIRYAGGEIPWQDERQPEAERQAETIWQTLEQNLSGLNGYIGIDWLWDEQAETLRLVELNPRLTTAYVGYRELRGTQIVESLLGPEVTSGTINGGSVRFSAAGTVETLPRQEAVP
jgi:hypothetical protein